MTKRKEAVGPSRPTLLLPSAVVGARTLHFFNLAAAPSTAAQGKKNWLTIHPANKLRSGPHAVELLAGDESAFAGTLRSQRKQSGALGINEALIDPL